MNNTEIFEVEIKRCSSSHYWYAALIGKTYEVKKHTESCYITVEKVFVCGDIEGQGLIGIEDCEITPSSQEKEDEQTAPTCSGIEESHAVSASDSAEKIAKILNPFITHLHPSERDGRVDALSLAIKQLVEEQAIAFGDWREDNARNKAVASGMYWVKGNIVPKKDLYQLFINDQNRDNEESK